MNNVLIHIRDRNLNINSSQLFTEYTYLCEKHICKYDEAST